MIILSWDNGKAGGISPQKKCLDDKILEEIEWTIDALPDVVIVNNPMII